MTTSKPIVMMTVDELDALVATAVAKGVKAALSDLAEADRADWLGPDAAAQIIGVIPRTLARMVQRKEIPASKVGRKLRFRRTDLDTYLARRAA